MMPRRQAFDETQVLDAAMHLFWSRGYAASGMAQLLEVTQLSPSSFYNAFESKKGIFLKALHHYIENVVVLRLQTYLAGPDPLQAIERFFLSAADVPAAQSLQGCLLTNTATENRKLDDDVAKVVWSGLKKIQTALKSRLVEAQEADLVKADLDPEQVSMHLLSCYQGMSVIGVLTQSKSRVRALARTAIANLQ